ncbi:MAG: DUF2029 domain-containing protein, partial [Oscillochloris sp.]|nr:DUF2029 domain-containing protein [Oscillochloris sp.]
MKSGAKLVRYGLLISLPALWFIYLIAQSPRGVDFFPLYFAAQRVLAGHSPYGAAATDALQQQWQAPFAHAGVAYPLPLILLIIPFSLLAFPLAAWLWTLLGAALTYLCVGIPRPDAAAWFVRHEQQWMLVLLPLAFMPFHRSVVVSQATLVWFGLAVVMLWAISRRQPWLVAGCIVLLALKPQNGLLVALYGAVWLFRTRARWLGLAAA